MSRVCNKCYVGGQYLMLCLHSKFLCIKCLGVKTKHIDKYEKKRLELCMKRHEELKAENIYSL